MELEFMRETGGYKAILQAVLKTQIKTLIEQLYDETGTESLFLMHSKDNSLSHLGSYGGKQFLAEQNDIKSQFLGYFQNDASFKKVTKHKMPFKDTEPAAKRQRTQTAEKATNPDAQQQNKHSNTNIMVQSSSHSIKTVHKNKDQTSDTVTVHQNKDQGTDNVDTESNEAEMEEQNYLSRDSSVEHTSPQPVIKVENVEGEDLAMTCVSVSENADHFNSDTEDDDDSKSIDGESHEDGNDTGQIGMVKNQNIIKKGSESSDNPDKYNVLCQFCAELFRDKRGFHAHLQACSGDPSIKIGGAIQYSDKRFHKADEDICKEMNKKHRCDVCGQVFANRNIFRRHAIACRSPLTIACPICDKEYSSTSHLKVHFLSHIEQPVQTFPCSNCNQVFDQIGQLKAHFVTHLAPVLDDQNEKEVQNMVHELEELVCDFVHSDGTFCNKQFTAKKNLQRHMQTHQERSKDFACKDCPKRYYRKEHLKEHIELTHSESLPSIPCPNCKKTFAHKRNLKKHLVLCEKQ